MYKVKKTDNGYTIVDKEKNNCLWFWLTIVQAAELCEYLNSRSEEYCEQFLADWFNGYSCFQFSEQEPKN